MEPTRNFRVVQIAWLKRGLRPSWLFDSRRHMFGMVNNLFDNRDALYGAYFDPLIAPALIRAL